MSTDPIQIPPAGPLDVEAQPAVGAIHACGDIDPQALEAHLSDLVDRYVEAGRLRPKARVSVAIGSRSYFDDLPLANNLTLGLPLWRRSGVEAELRTTAELLGLDPSGPPTPRARYLCCLARSLVARPDVLVIVDPGAHLSSETHSQFETLIARRRAEGRFTLIGLTSFDPRTLALVDHLSVRRNERVAFSGPPDLLGPRLAELLFTQDSPGVNNSLARMATEFTLSAESTQVVAQAVCELLAEIFPGTRVGIELCGPDGGSSIAIRGGQSHGDDHIRNRLRHLLATAEFDAVGFGPHAGDVAQLHPLWSHRELVGAAYFDRVPEVRLVDPAAALQALAPGVGAFIDRRRQGQLDRDRARIDAVHTLVGGIAHDLNNSLQSVVGAADLVATKLTDLEMRPIVEVLQTTASDAAAFVAKLLAFSRSTEREKVAVDMHQVVNDAVEIVRRGTAQPMQVELGLTAMHPIVVGSALELRNVMVNLLLNAVQASPVDGAHLIITTRNDDSDPDGAEHLEVDVRDHGRGVSKEIRGQLFEPFVSERDGSMGTGLGLAVASSILAEHDATIELLSTSSKGTTFRMRLPNEPTLAESASPEKVIDTDDDQDHLTVLIVDDEPIVSEVLAEMIDYLGHKAVSAIDGETGLQTLADNWGHVDVCIVDQLMPGINGDQVISKMRERGFGGGIIWLSGYRGPAPDADDVAADLRLPKPISLDALADALQIVSHRDPAATSGSH